MQRAGRRRKGGAGCWRQLTAMTFAGVGLVVAFAATGYLIGSVAVGGGGAPLNLALALQPVPSALLKGSLAASPVAGIEAAASVEEQPIKASLAPANLPPASLALASLESASLVSAKSDVLPRARIAERSDRLYRLLSPPVALLEESWRKGRERRRLIAEHMCLARAIYFEARSESEIGRLAVAQVILNRVKSPFYPDTICDVVYQNSAKRNGCQFSFACDGESDNPRPGRAWKLAKALASRAMAGDGEVQAIATATNYHADYVRPEWSGAMTRLVQIGRHIFYDGS